MPSFIERLARRVVNLETKVNRALTSPQLGSSSIEDGTLEEYDGDGQLVTIIGKQPDGTHGAVVVSGPNPPRPSAPIVSGGPGLLNYGWDGNFADEATGGTDITIPAPMDFGRVEAHASKLQGFAADTAATLLDTLESPRGGSRTVMLEPGTWFVKLVTRALSGKRSAESLEVSVEVLAPAGSDVDVDALRDEFQAADADLNQAIIQNKQAQDTLAGTVTTLQETTLPALDSGLALANARLVSARTELDMLTGVAPLPEVYAQHIASYTAAFQQVDIKNLFVTGESALNTVTAQRIAANVASFLQVSTDQLTAGTANIGTAVVDKLFAEMFATRKLFANQVIIGEPGNLHPDPNFLDPSGWQIASGYSILPGDGRNGNNALAIDASAAQMGRYYGAADRQRQFRVTGGSTYRVSVWVKPDAVVPINGIAVYSKWTNPGTAVAGSFTTPGNSGNKTALAANTWSEITHEFPVPAEATQAFIGLYVQSTANTRVIFSELSVKEVVTPSLIVDGFFQGLRVIGASIETNAAENVGMKFTDNGLVAYGIGTDYDPVGQVNILYNTKVSIDTRVPAWTSFPTDRVPGLWFEATRQTAAGATPPAVPAALVPSNAAAQGITMQSSQQLNRRDYRSAVTVDPNFATIVAQSSRTSDNAVPGSQTVFNLNTGGWYLQTMSGTNVTSELKSESGKLRINGAQLGATITEYTCTGNKANFAVADQDISTPVRQAASSTATLATPGVGSLTVLEEGIYGVDFQVILYTNSGLTNPKATTGRSFMDISDGNDVAYSRTGIVPGEDQGTGSIVGKKLQAGDRLKFRFIQTTGGLAYYRANIRLIRLA